MKDFFDVSEIKPTNVYENGDLVKINDSLIGIVQFSIKNTYYIKIGNKFEYHSVNEIKKLSEKECQKYLEKELIRIKELIDKNSLITLDSDGFVFSLPTKVIFKRK
jgi:hypothetical protein